MIWLFGDSFSVPKGNSPVEHLLWSQNLSINLNEEITYRAQWGVSNEWILNEFISNQENFNEGDRVIIQLTSPERQWFFEDSPELGNFYVEDLDKRISKDKALAVKKYIQFLENKNLTSIRTNLYHLGIKQITEIFKHVHILILPGYTTFYGINGVLMDICNGEFVNEQSCANWYSKHKIDPRANHISEINHRILSEKITEYFLTGTPIDLKSRFEQGFL